MKRLAIITITVLTILAGGAGAALADPPNGNSGHVGANAHQCKHGTDHCPPFGH